MTPRFEVSYSDKMSSYQPVVTERTKEDKRKTAKLIASNVENLQNYTSVGKVKNFFPQKCSKATTLTRSMT